MKYSEDIIEKVNKLIIDYEINWIINNYNLLNNFNLSDIIIKKEKNNIHLKSLYNISFSDKGFYIRFSTHDNEYYLLCKAVEENNQEIIKWLLNNINFGTEFLIFFNDKFILNWTKYNKLCFELYYNLNEEFYMQDDDEFIHYSIDEVFNFGYAMTGYEIEIPIRYKLNKVDWNLEELYWLGECFGKTFNDDIKNSFLNFINSYDKVDDYLISKKS